MNDEAAFLAALAENPHDETTRQVFADWLEERGDPRSAWVRDRDIFRWIPPGRLDPVPSLIRELGKKRTQPAVTLALRRVGRAALPALIEAYREGTPKVREHAREVLLDLGPQAGELLPDFQREARSEEVETRRQAIRALGSLGEAAAIEVPFLIKQLEHEDDGIFLAAAEALGRIGPAARSAIPPLTEAMPRASQLDDEQDLYGFDTRKQAQMTIVEAIGGMGPAALDALPLLLDCLGYYNADMLEACCSILGKLGTVVLEPVLRKIQEMESDCEHWGVSIVTAFGDEAIPYLVRALEDTESQGHRIGAMRVIAELGESRRRPERLGETALPLARVLRFCDSYEAGFVLPALRALGDDARPAIPALRQRLDHQEDPYSDNIRPEIIDLLKSVGDRFDALADLKTRLKDASPQVRSNAVRSIHRLEISAQEKAALFRGALGDDSAEVRTRVLGEVHWQVRADPALWLPVVRQALHDPEADIRARVATALGQEEPLMPEVVPELLSLLEDPSEEVQRSAIEGLACQGKGNPEVAEALRACLRSPSEKVRQAASSALEEVGLVPASFLDDLVEGLRDPSYQVRRNVLQTMSTLDRVPARFAELLLGCLEDPDLGTALATLPVIGKLEDAPERVLAALWTILREGPDRGRAPDEIACFNPAILKTLHALGQLTEEAIPYLIQSTTERNSQDAEATGALLTSFGALAVPGLREVVRTSSGTTRYLALHALGQLKGDAVEALPEIVAMLDSTERDTTLAALGTLAEVGPGASDTVPQVLPLLRHEDRHVRDAARHTLARMAAACVAHLPAIIRTWQRDDCPDPHSYIPLFCELVCHAREVISLLREVCTTAPSWQLTQVADRLGELGPDAAEAIPELLRLLEDPWDGMRLHVVTALGKIGVGTPEVLDALRRVAKYDVADNVREAAQEALARLGPPTAS